MHHETEICEFRKPECHDCANLRKEVKEVKLNAQGQFKEMKENQIELKRQITKQSEQIKSAQEQILEQSEQITKQSDQIRSAQEQILKQSEQITKQSEKIAKQSEQMRCMKEEIINSGEAKKGGKELCFAQTAFVSGSSNFNSKQDIVILGGQQKGRLSRSMQSFTWATKVWKTLLPMTRNERMGASYVVHREQIIVAGGKTSTCSRWPRELATNSMETRTYQELEYEQWSDFPAKLPSKCYNLKSVVYKDQLITIGGWDDEKHACSDSISQVLLVPPYAARFLTKMPQPRFHHGAELLDDKILIVGGRTSIDCSHTLDSVLMYNVNTNECKQMAPLPFPVSEMATVSSGDNVFVIGGKDKDGKVLRSVVMYDVKTGLKELLPEMTYPRAGCSAVTTGNVAVVIGGYDQDGDEMCTVECLELDRYVWKELPHMKVALRWTTAIVIPAKTNPAPKLFSFVR